MKVYYITHYYDNGESYEDYREYEDTQLYSDINNANSIYWAKVVSDYNGKYIFGEWEIDSQNKTILEESVYIKCKSCYEDVDYENVDYEDYYPDYNDSEMYIDCFSSEKYITEEEENEISEEEEWLTHKGENYKLFQEIEINHLLKLLKELDK